MSAHDVIEATKKLQEAHAAAMAALATIPCTAAALQVGVWLRGSTANCILYAATDALKLDPPAETVEDVAMPLEERVRLAVVKVTP